MAAGFAAGLSFDAGLTSANMLANSALSSAIIFNVGILGISAAYNFNPIKVYQKIYDCTKFSVQVLGVRCPDTLGKITKLSHWFTGDEPHIATPTIPETLPSEVDVQNGIEAAPENSAARYTKMYAHEETFSASPTNFEPNHHHTEHVSMNGEIADFG